MGYQNTIDILLNDTEDLKELLLYVKDKDKISAIEVDLAMDKMRQMYDKFRNLQKEETSDAQETPPGRQVSDESVVSGTSDAPEKLKPENETTEEPPAIEERPVEKEDFEVRPKTQQQPPITEEEMAMTLGDKYKSISDSLNDHMGKSKKTSDIASKYQSKPIKNIHTAIGLNEKFQLIKSLFKGDSDLYNQTIDTLNHASNFNEAYMYLNENFNWNMEDAMVKRILDLTRRKFISTHDE